MRLVFLSLVSIIFCDVTSATNPKKRAWVIGIDGAKSSEYYRVVFRQRQAPNLYELTKSGQYRICLDVKSMNCARAHRGPQLKNNLSWKTGPGWASVVTGLDSLYHKVGDNGKKDLSMFTKTTEKYPTFFSILKQNGHQTAASGVSTFLSVFSEKKTKYGVLDYECGHENSIPLVETYDRTSCNLDFRFAPSGKDKKRDERMALWTKMMINRSHSSLIMTVFDRLDAAGHKHGFSNNKKYHRSFSELDPHIGLVMDAIKQRVREHNEQWLIVLTSDHGGHSILGRFGQHHKKPYDDDAIPFVVATLGSKKKVRPLIGPITHMDVFATVLKWFNVPYQQFRQSNPQGI